MIERKYLIFNNIFLQYINKYNYDMKEKNFKYSS